MTKHRYSAKRYYYRSTDEPNICQVNTYDSFSEQALVPARIKEFDGKPITAWKKATLTNGAYGSSHTCIVELLIPARAIRFQPKNKKCRATSAHVVAIYELVKRGGYGRSRLGAKTKKKIAYSRHDCKFKYHVGKKVKSKGEKFNKDHRKECAAGIHFFLTSKEAANY